MTSGKLPPGPYRRQILDGAIQAAIDASGGALDREQAAGIAAAVLRWLGPQRTFDGWGPSAMAVDLALLAASEELGDLE